MRKIPISFWLGGLATLGVFAAFLFWGIPYFWGQPAAPMGESTTFGAQTSRARVTQILEEGEIDLGGNIQPYQLLRVELLEGEYSGILMEVDVGRRQLRPETAPLATGDEVFVTIGKRPDGVLEAFYVDTVREKALLLLVGLFAAAILLMGRWKGLRALLAMVFSLAIIISYVIPRILAGEDPVIVSLIGSGVLLTVTLYLTYGWTLKTHASVVGMALVLIITGTLAALFVNLARLTGYGSEDALFLMQMGDFRINLRGLLLGGMLIGALGVLDDLVTTQSSVVFELHHTDPTLRFRALFQKAMRIGQDHVAATVNTLVLAYAGASLPTLLMFTLGRGNVGFLLNSEMVAEEIVRTLVGSLGLMAAVPLTTGLAALFALYHHHIPPTWRNLLGPEGEGHHH